VGNAAALTVVKEANVMLYAGVPAQMLVFSKGTL
jgi:hypothetical protein